MYNRGSEWRKWDLHVHTPCSIVNNYKGGDDSWERFILDLESLPKDIKVLGINDYIFLDGYQKVLEYKKKGRLNNIELILPVIELRLARFCGTTSFKRINYHIIFSDKLTPEIINAQFICRLNSFYKLDPYSNQNSWDGIITKENLEILGKKIIESVPPNQKSKYDNPLKEGFNNLNIEVDDIKRALKCASSYFEGKYLTGIGKTEWDEFKWNDASIGEKKTIINDVDFIFTAAESIEKYNNGKKKLEENGVNSLLLDCSDAHCNIDCHDNKDRLGNCFTWIKADPTFEGLKEAIIEADERIFIGDVPPLFKRIEENKTKFIDKIFISQRSGIQSDDKWFERTELLLNKELVAIIGNKGNGKSAIADIIAHCCDVTNQSYFSFLNCNKFRKGGLADRFYASVYLENGNELKKDTLGEQHDVKNVEPYVKYLPQGYFESICNDLQKEGDLRVEIENVVFQYIDQGERLGVSNFKELIDKKTELIEEEIEDLKVKLTSINKSIIALEKKENAKYSEFIISEITKKEAELNSLSVPVEVKKPDTSSQEIQATLTEIEYLNSLLVKLEDEIDGKIKEKQHLSESILSIESLMNRIYSMGDKLEEFKSNICKSISELGLNVDDVIKFSINPTKIKEIIKKKKNDLSIINTQLSKDPLEQSSLFVKKSKLEQGISNKKQSLRGAELEYQNYIKKQKEYDRQRNDIIGSRDKPCTLEWYKSEKEFLEKELDLCIASECSRRDTIVSRIYEKKLETIKIYKDIKSKIDARIAENSELLHPYNIKIDASFSIDESFKAHFFSNIRQSVKGSFKGKVEGEALLKKVIAEHDIQSVEGVITFCNRLIYLLKHDLQKGEERRFVDEQIDDIQSLYNYIFSLDYLHYNYQLKQGDKDLSLLSPGEKGSLLLIFYLLLDIDNKPLILDQPEDNLDNNSIANILVHFIKKAKKKRQIIMVTHNPNLAIVADAEQVVYVHIDKLNNYKFSLESGSIENPQINKHIVDVLEGAMPAFRKRDDKYNLTQNY